MDYITPILQKGRRSPGWEQKWPGVRSERTRDRTLGLPGQPTDSANCHMLTVCALSRLWDTSGNQRHLQLTDKCVEGGQFPREDSPLWESLQTLHQRTGPANLDPSNKSPETPDTKRGVGAKSHPRLWQETPQHSWSSQLCEVFQKWGFQDTGVSFGGEAMLWSCELLSRKTRLLGDPKSLSISRPSSGSSMPATLKRLP